jgi:antitoxin component HigA of HigAB toxin-antitoxin module
LIEKHEGKRLLGKPKSSLENIKVYMKRYGKKGCGLGPVVGSVNMIRNVQARENKGNCFTG